MDVWVQLTIISHENFYGSIWDSSFDSFEEFLVNVDVFCVSDCPSNGLPCMCLQGYGYNLKILYMHMYACVNHDYKVTFLW